MTAPPLTMQTTVLGNGLSPIGLARLSSGRIVVAVSTSGRRGALSNAAIRGQAQPGFHARMAQLAKCRKDLWG
jgi:hypothetical protein